MKIRTGNARTLDVEMMDWESAQVGEVLSVKFIVYPADGPEEFDVILTVLGMKDDGDVENGPAPYPAPYDVFVTELAVETIQYAPAPEMAAATAKLIVDQWQWMKEKRTNRERQQRAENREFEAHMGRG